jgi:hypothetical protein
MGTPIYSWNKKEVWAYWADNCTTNSRYVLFRTVRQFLGDDEPSRQPEVCWNGSIWTVGPDTTQADLHDSPLFFINPMQGPQARLAAIRTLKNDPNFMRYFQLQTDGIDAYERFAEARAKDSVPF